MKTRSKPSRCKVGERPLLRIEGVRIDALLDERRQHGVAGQERDLALRRRAAHQHGDLCRSPLIARLTHDLHLGLEVDPGALAHDRADVRDDRFDVRGLRRALAD